VTQTLGDELKRNFAAMVAKLKAKLIESSNSLKMTLEAMGAPDEKCRQVRIEANKAKRKVLALEVKLQMEKVDRAKVEEEKRVLALKVEKIEVFLLHISKNCFFQVIFQVAYYHGTLVNDDRYNVEKDVMNRQLVSVRGDDEDNGQGEN